MRSQACFFSDIYCIMGRGVCGDAMENANVSGSLTRASGWLYRLYGHLGPGEIDCLW